MNMGQETNNGNLWKFLTFAIHPDHNPNVKNAGEKLTKVMDNKNNEAYLKMLAAQWGIVLPPNFQPTEEDVRRFYYYGRNALYVGNFVEILVNKKDQNRIAIRGFVVDKKSVDDGFKIYICDDYDTIRVILVKNENLDIIRERKDNVNLYTDVRKANEIYKKYKQDLEKKEKAKKVKTDYQKYKELFKNCGLKMNTDYKYYGIKMNYNGIIYDVIKTTTRKVKLSYLNIIVEVKIEDCQKVYA